MKRLATAVIAVLALAAVLMPASALAKDRNHDKIPDKWEKRYHLSLSHNQARKDQDHDGLRNLAEYRDQTNPRKSDTDNDGLDDGAEVATGHDPTSDDGDHDGVEDGNENAGTIKSFDGGVLTITLAKGGEISGTVTDATEIDCGSQDDQGDDNQSGDDRVARTSDSSGDTGDGGEGDSESGSPCSSTALTPGATVKEAELDGSAFHDVELLG
jgi:hypothetical protein